MACAKARAYIEYSGTAKSMNGPVHCRILASIFYSFNVIEKTSVCGNRVARVAHMRIMVELLTINDPFYSKSIGVREVNFWCVCATATPTSFFLVWNINFVFISMQIYGIYGLNYKMRVYFVLSSQLCWCLCIYYFIFLRVMTHKLALQITEWLNICVCLVPCAQWT